MIKQFKIKGFIVYAFNLEQAESTFKERYPFYKNKLLEIKEIDYEKWFAYFPYNEIKDEDKPFIYDHRGLNSDDHIVSLPLSIARKYDSYIDKLPKEPLVSGIYH